jgi:mannose-6-phosphate isomerase-like protein (cupin superfamily)
MARPGRMMANPVTGERFTFIKTSAGTGGELLQMDVALQPGHGRLLRHVHPRQEERMSVQTEGGRFWVAGKEFEAHRGDVVTVPAGAPHQFWNTGAEELRLLVEFRPALNQEQFFELLCQLGQEGKTNRKGIPSPLLAAMVLRDHLGDNRVTIIPSGAQRLLVPFADRLGRLLGYERKADELMRRAVLE